MPDMSELLAAERNKVLELEAKLAEAKYLVNKYHLLAANNGLPFTTFEALALKVKEL